jgi:hypothetical protein
VKFVQKVKTWGKHGRVVPKRLSAVLEVCGLKPGMEDNLMIKNCCVFVVWGEKLKDF